MVHEPLLLRCYYSVRSASTFIFFFFNDTATTEIYTLSLHDALPICRADLVLEWTHGYEGQRLHPHRTAHRDGADRPAGHHRDPQARQHQRASTARRHEVRPP